MDDLLSDFIAETRETADAIAEEIVLWEAAPGDRVRLDGIFRFVHTVKGSCGFLDLPRLERLSHAAEETLASVRSDLRVPDAALVSAVLAIIDRIRAIVDAMDAGDSVPDGDDAALIAALDPDAASDDGAGSATTLVPAMTMRVPARSIRVPVELLDRMMAGMSDLVLARNELARGLRVGGSDAAAVTTGFERLTASIEEMRETITRTRMARVDHLFSALPRLVRDLSGELDKRVTLAIDGGDVELDREMIEMVRDPLTHIVRNAIDHGIEPPADRVFAGKPAAGSLRIAARQAGNQIVIEVVDDGRGIDVARLRDKAVSSGVLTREQAARLDGPATLDLIFQPGLTTKAAATAISGRGVGMDVVRANVERIGGQVAIASEPGVGLRVTLHVPMTLTIMPALTLSAGGQSFAVPRSAIDEIVRAASDAVRIEEGCGMRTATIRGERLPLVRLATVLGVAAGAADPAILIVLRPGGGGRFALGVDAVHDHEELVVKPAAPEIMGLGVYAGITLPDDNRPMLLLDAAGIARNAGVVATAAVARAEPAVPAEERVPTLLFRDLDGADRAIRLAVIERIDDIASDACHHVGGGLRVTQDGAMLPLLTMTGTPPQGSRVRILRIGDGTLQVAYAIDHVIDIADLPRTMVPVTAPGPVAGVILVGDRPVELVDPYWMLATGSSSQGRPAAEAARPVALLVGEDGHWMREILRPLVEAAGYAVAFDGEAAAGARIVIADGAVLPPVPAGVATLALEARPDAGGPGIWRYDQAGLARALAAARTGAC